MPFPTPGKDDVEVQMISWYSENSDEFKDDDSESSEYDSEEEDEKKKFQTDNSKFTIHIFGKDINEKTYCIKVEDFTPYFYVMLPDQLKSNSVEVFEDWVRNSMWKKHQHSFLRCTFHKKKKFRNFDGGMKYNFARLVFSNTDAMRCAVNLFQDKKYDQINNRYKVRPKKCTILGLYNKPFEYSLFENMVDPILKFIHHKDLESVGWLKIDKKKYYIPYQNDTRCDYYLATRWNNIKKLSDRDNSKIIVMSYDIEADSSHGDFPLPIKDYTKFGRELYISYCNLQSKHSKYNHIEEKKKFIIDCLKAAFKNGDEKLGISKIYLKNKNQKMSNNILKKISTELSQYLTISTSVNSLEIKRDRENSINQLIKILSGDDKNNSILPQIRGDETIQIGMSFIKYGEKIPFKNYMLTLKNCDKLDNCETICFSEESELLLKFKDIINDENPDIITGWNIDGFDTPWLFKRASELGIFDQFSKMSRFKDYSSILKEKQKKGHTGELITVEYVDIPGRIQMDLLPLVQKSYNLDSYKLDSVSAQFINGKVYKIDYDEELNESTIYTDSLAGLNNNNFIVFSELDGYLDNKYNNGEKYEIYDKKIENKNDNEVLSFKIKDKILLDLKFKTNWCLGKDDVSPKDIFRLQKGSNSDRYTIAKYCLMDVILCIELMNKLELLTNNIGMANVCMIPLSWIIQRGQGVRILSLVACFLRKKDFLIPYLYKDSFDKEGYEGAVVLDPKPGIYIDKPVAVLDYGSLYPSSMIEFNISHETIVTNDKYLGIDGASLLNDLGYDYKDVTYDRYKTIFTPAGAVKEKIKVGIKTVRYVQYRDGKKGMVPMILEHLLGARKSTRTKAKFKTIVVKNEISDEITYVGLYNKNENSVKCKEGTFKLDDIGEIVSIQDRFNEFQKNVLDGLQLAFKVTANSLYGGLGAKTSDFYYKELAASTTAVGRDRLLLAKDFALNEKNYPQKLHDGRTIFLKNEIIYGDTDSIFVHFQSLDDNGNPLKGRDARVKNIQLAQYTEKEIQKILEKPQVLEYEKTFDPFLLISKKRYVGDLFENDPDKSKTKSMGLVLKRRDNAPIVKVIYGGIIDIIMKEKNIHKASVFFRKSLRKLINGTYKLDTLVITKTLSGFYKDPDRVAHKVLAERIAERDPGNKPQVNDRIPFVYIVTDKETKLQGDKIETPTFIVENNLTPDYEFYITNQIMKPVTQIFALCLDKLPGYKNNLESFNLEYKKYIDKGKSINDSIKHMNECKRKEAQHILLDDILRILSNKRKKNKEITDFFRINNSRPTIENEYESDSSDDNESN